MTLPDFDTLKWFVGLVVIGPIGWIMRLQWKLEDRVKNLEEKSATKDELRDAIASNRDLNIYNRDQLDKIRDHLIKN